MNAPSIRIKREESSWVTVGLEGTPDSSLLKGPKSASGMPTTTLRIIHPVIVR
jgi:hypothetical protein